MTERGRRSTTAIAATVLVESARRASSHRVSSTEAGVFRAFNQLPAGVHIPVWAVMQSGSLIAVFVVGAELARRGRRHTAATALITGTAVWSGVKAIKPLIGRGRPAVHLKGVSVRGQAQTGLGYPSGHAAVAMTLALIATRGASPSQRALSIAIAWVTGGARMYVGAHLPLDVAGGLAIGLFCGRAGNAVLDRRSGSLRLRR